MSIQLAELQREFRAPGLVKYYTSSVIGILAGLIVVGVGWLFFRGDNRWGLMGIGGLAAAFGAFFLCVGPTFKALRLYSNGLSIDGVGDIPFSNIVSTRGSLPVRYRGTPFLIDGPFQMTLDDGRIVGIPSDYPDQEVLVQRIQDAVAERVQPRLVRDFERGETLEFGKVSIDRNHIAVDGERLEWSNYSHLSFDPDNVYIHAGSDEKPWKKVALSKIKDANCLVPLLGRLTGGSADTFRTVGERDADSAGGKPVRAAADRLADAVDDDEDDDDVADYSPASPAAPATHARTLGGILKAHSKLILVGTLVLIGLGVAIPLMLFARASSLTTIGLGVGGAIAAIAATVALWLDTRAYASFARVDNEGLSWIFRGEEHDQPWTAVEEVWTTNVYTVAVGGKPSEYNRETKLRLQFQDGSTAQFNHAVSEYDALVSAVQSRAALANLASSLTKLEMGKLSFGPVELNRQGMRFFDSEDTLEWNKVAKLWVGNGFLGIESAAARAAEIPLYDIPNYTLLLAILRSKAGDKFVE